MFTCVSNLLLSTLLYIQPALSQRHSWADRSGPCPALGTQSHITAERQSSHSTHGLSRLPDAAYQNLHFSCSGAQTLLRSVSSRHIHLTAVLSGRGWAQLPRPPCVWLARPGCSRGRARSLPALRAPHLLAQPELHVDLGSPCGIRWGGGGKTTVSFTHRLSKPGAISLGLAEESSTLLQLFNPCSAKPFCVPRAMTALVCRGGICRSVIILKLPKATQEGWVILTER